MKTIIIANVACYKFKVKMNISRQCHMRIIDGKKVKSAHEPKWPITAGAYPGFLSMKRLLLLDKMLVHRRIYPPALSGFPDSSPVPIFLLGGERHCESKMSCPRTQHNDPVRARTLTSPSTVWRPTELTRRRFCGVLS